MKLVRSIQNSITQSGDEETHGGCHHRKPQADAMLPRPEEPIHHPNCSSGVAADSSPLPDLLDSSPNNKHWNGEEKTRPRSCIDHTVHGTGGFSLVTDIASTVKKRWSGIHLGSKLFQAFDRLGTEDTEEEYSDSLENRPRRRHTSTSSNNSTSDDITREESPLPIVATLEPQTGENRSSVGTGGGKFKRLQMKWEMLSGKEVNSNDPSPTGNSLSPNQASDSTSGSTPTSRSKIPRLVTSPVRSSDITITSPQPTQVKKVNTSQLRKPSNFSSKLKISPAATAKESVEGKTQINKTSGTNVSPAVKNHPSAVTRCSRVDQLHSTDQGSGLKGHAARPSSLPYRPSISAQGNKRGQLAVKPDTQRRAASTSLNRQRNEGTQARQR